MFSSVFVKIERSKGDMPNFSEKKNLRIGITCAVHYSIALFLYLVFCERLTEYICKL